MRNVTEGIELLRKGNYSDILIGRTIAILYFLVRKITGGCRGTR